MSNSQWRDVMTTLPNDHPLRQSLNDEAHARPPESLSAPTRLSFLALGDDGIARSRHEAAIRDLCNRFGVVPPAPEMNHFSRDLGPFRVKWEKHTEFTRYKFITLGEHDRVFDKVSIDEVPKDWLADLPGKIIAAAHVEFQASPGGPVNIEETSRRWFAGNALVGATVANEGASAFTDFRIHNDGFSRFLVYDRSLTLRQAGRTIQRLVEIDAYRMLAMMSLPVARQLGPILSQSEAELIEITSRLASGATSDEPQLLDRLTRLEAQIQQHLFLSAPRFSASDAYHRLVQRRTEELREGRLEGVQTFKEFIDRRLVPAMNTCASSSVRLEKMSQRVAETTALLSTRVEVSRQRQAAEQLAALNRRAQIQLRMQETVEGLSVAAITYYVVGLVAYVTKGLSTAGAVIRPDLAVAISVPIVAILVAIGVRRVRLLTGLSGREADHH